MDNKAIDSIWLALNQNQPFGNSRFYAKIEATTGQRREAKPRDEFKAHEAVQDKMGL